MFKNSKQVLGMVALIVMGVMCYGHFAKPVWAQRAAIIQDLDNPDKKEIYSKTFHTNLTNGNHFVNVDAAPVPAGKQLIIEYITGYMDSTSGLTPLGFLYVDTSDFAALYFVGTPFNFITTTTAFIINQPTRFRVASGHIWGVGVSRGNGVGESTIDIAVRGYLINIP